MDVFSVGFDHKRYQMIGTMPGFIENYPHTTDRAPLLQDWKPMTATVNDQSKRRGDFLMCGVNYLVCRRDVTGAFGQSIRNDVQLLPMKLEGEVEEYDLWNIKTFVDALDAAKTVFRPPPLRSLPLEWGFKPESLLGPMLFRTPQVSTDILVATGFHGREDDDFYLKYKSLKLKGLKFEHLWSEK